MLLVLALAHHDQGVLQLYCRRACIEQDSLHERLGGSKRIISSAVARVQNARNVVPGGLIADMLSLYTTAYLASAAWLCCAASTALTVGSSC